MIIVLIGYMGSGKSTVGRYLADILNYDFMDLDEYLVDKENDTIPDIFRTKGEIYFRRIEMQYLEEVLANHDNIVLALGGGTPCYGNNMQMIIDTEKVKSFYLKLSIPSLSERLFTQKENRPLISHLNSKEELLEFIGKHLFERVPFYTMANYSIDADDKSVKDISESILLALI